MELRRRITAGVGDITGRRWIGAGAGRSLQGAFDEAAIAPNRVASERLQCRPAQRLLDISAEELQARIGPRMVENDRFYRRKVRASILCAPWIRDRRASVGALALVTDPSCGVIVSGFFLRRARRYVVVDRDVRRQDRRYLILCLEQRPSLRRVGFLLEERFGLRQRTEAPVIERRIGRRRRHVRIGCAVLEDGRRANTAQVRKRKQQGREHQRPRDSTPAIHGKPLLATAESAIYSFGKAMYVGNFLHVRDCLPAAVRQEEGAA